MRLAGLEDRAPRVAVMSRWLASVPAATKLASREALLIDDIDGLAKLDGVTDVLVEGGAGAAAALLAADMVDRLAIYRAPIVIGDGLAGIADIGLFDLADAHGRWRPVESRALGKDRLEVYERTR